MPTAARMSDLSRGHSAVDDLPNGQLALGGAAGTRVGLDQHGAHRLKEAHLDAHLSGLVAGAAEREPLAQGEHSVLVAAVGALLGLVVLFADGLLVLLALDEVNGVGQEREALGAAGLLKAGVVKAVEHGPDNVELLEENGDRLGLIHARLLAVLGAVLT